MKTNTCPNCGAEMERHAFTHVCSYCGYIHAGKETKRNIPRGKTEDSSRFYDYISKHLQYIQQSPFVNIESKHDCYECISSKPFYANDGHYTLDKSLSFWWHAKVTKLGIAFNLLVKPKHTNSRNYLCIKEGRNVFSFKQKGEILDKLIFPMTLEDFLFPLLPALAEIGIVINVIKHKHNTLNILSIIYMFMKPGQDIVTMFLLSTTLPVFTTGYVSVSVINTS